MKALLRIASTAVFMAAFGFGAHAERADEPDKTVTASVGEASDGANAQALDPAGDKQSIAALVHEALGSPSDDEEGETLTDQSLRAFYAGDATPIWVSEAGPNEKARKAAEEIVRARDFALDPNDFALPQLEGGKTDRAALAEYELAMTRVVLEYAQQARAGRVHPSSVGHSLNEPEGLNDPRGFLQALRDENDVAGVLRDLHPKHPQFVALQKKLAELRGGGGNAPRAEIPDGPVLKIGETHEHVALLRKRLGVEDGEKAEVFDDAVEQAVKGFQKQKGLKADGVVGNNTRRLLNGESNEQLAVRIIANMERWRWLPDDMAGEAGIFVWANVPEYRVRIVKGGEVAFDERMIAGKTNKQTPVFSDEMEWIELHPTWYVPMSIMVEDIGPSLRRPTSTVMERYHLQLNCGAHGTDWKKIDWNRVSIRNCSVSQPPGDKSVLGDFKFKFPNKHDVYMHDTPIKGLFNATVRTFSHGCMRIRNPRRMAEILLGHDKGMTPERIGEILDGPKRLHKEELNRHVAVHVTYFTVFFDKAGQMQTRSDVYGHDRRLAQALTGKGHLLPAPAIAVSRKRERAPTREARDRVWSNAFTAN